MQRYRPYGFRHFLVYGFILYGLVLQLHHWLWLVIILGYEFYAFNRKPKRT